MNLNNKILSAEIKSLISKLNNEFPDLIFGGSIALNAVGLIERKIGDIDIFVPEKHKILQSNYVLEYISSENQRLKDNKNEQPKNVFDYFSKQSKNKFDWAEFGEMKANEDVFSENGLCTLRTGIIIDNIKVCIFEVQNEDELKSFRFKIDDSNEINLQNIFHAIKTKCLYVRKSFSPNFDKHLSDLSEIYHELKSIDKELKGFEMKKRYLV